MQIERRLIEIRDAHLTEEKIQKFQQDILSRAKVVFCTLDGGGLPLLQETCDNKISYLIVDEACQITEPACLMPFRWNPKRVILVGDQKQLAAFTLSDKDEKTRFSRSLFERLVEDDESRKKRKEARKKLMQINDQPIENVRKIKPLVLNEQYRMHPAIRQFSSGIFYPNKKIIDAAKVLQRKFEGDDFAKLEQTFKERVIFFDLMNSVEEGEISKCNEMEAKFTLHLIKYFADLCGVKDMLAFKKRIAVITPYLG